MQYLMYFFPFFFIGIWLLVCFTIAKMGWTALAANYQYDHPFAGQTINMVSASINGANYKSSLTLKYSEEGLYLNPIFFFRFFHKPILIPWKDIQYIQDKKLPFFTIKELTVGMPTVAVIGINESVYRQLSTYFDTNTAKR